MPYVKVDEEEVKASGLRHYRNIIVAAFKYAYRCLTNCIHWLVHRLASTGLGPPIPTITSTGGMHCEVPGSLRAKQPLTSTHCSAAQRTHEELLV